MKVTYNRHNPTNELYDLTLVCSPLEALTILEALRRMTTGDAPELDKEMAERLYKEMKGQKE